MGRNVKIKFPVQAEELAKLLKADQDEYQEFAREYLEVADKTNLGVKRERLFRHFNQRAERMLQILKEIGEPSISNIGKEGAIAISVLATHSSFNATNHVLAAFKDLYIHKKDDTYYKSIPPMVDWLLVLSRKPQKFGTIWLMDKHNEPFLPTIKDFKHVNERRAEYDLDPLRWPRSLSIPKSNQPWLKQPLTELIMREPTDKEFEEFTKDYQD